MERHILTGAEAQFRAGFPLLRGRRVALVTNHTSVCSGGWLPEILLRSGCAQLLALLSPEHGLRGTEDGPVASALHPTLRVPIYSLYGETHKPPAQALDGAEMLVFDIQHVGARFYTYESTMRYCLEAAAAARIPFVVLDRPNPLGGDIVEGPVLEAGCESFVGALPVPVRHGMTMGELAGLARDWLRLDVDLVVARMQGWERWMDYEATGLPWIRPSPAMISPSTARAYPGTCLLEGTNISEGRGTETPFEVVGAPFVSPSALVTALRRASLPGCHWEAAEFVPTRSKWAGQPCYGVRLNVSDARVFRSLSAGIHLLAALRHSAGEHLEWREDTFDRLIGNGWVRTWIEQGRGADEIIEAWGDGLEDFRKRRSDYLLY